MSFIFRWCWLLGLALFVPLGLSISSEKLNQYEIVRRTTSSPLLAMNSCSLRTSPYKKSPTLCNLNVGAPMRVIRYWMNENNEVWVHVEVLDDHLDRFAFEVRHGWMNV